MINNLVSLFRHILATKKYDILIFQLVGYAVHIAMSQFHILEPWWVGNDTKKYVKLWHVWYCTPLRHDSWIVGHSVVLWSIEKPWGRGLVEQKACISWMKRWNLTLNGTILIGCFKTAFLPTGFGARSQKATKGPTIQHFHLISVSIHCTNSVWMINFMNL